MRGSTFDKPVLSMPTVSFDKLRTNGWHIGAQAERMVVSFLFHYLCNTQ
jgi:hypothetical protein